MGRAGRWTNEPLRTALLAQSWEFDFYQAVTLLARLQREGRAPGLDSPFQEEGVRFAAWPELAPTASQVRSITRINGESAGSDTYHVTDAIFGLYGMNAPGPAYMFEAAATGRDPSVGQVLRSFLDMFGNRLTTLLYRAWLKYRWPLRFRRSGTDSITRRVFCFLGLGTPFGLSNEHGSILAEHRSLDPIQPRLRLLRYLGLFSQRVRCPSNLRGMLWDYFGGPDPLEREFVKIEEFVPSWLELGEARRCRLGESNSRLPGTARRKDELMLGERIRDCVGRFRIVFGPLDLPTFRKFLPTGSNYDVVLALVDAYRPDRLEYDIKLRLRADQVPSLRVGKESQDRLGRSTWLQAPGRGRREEGTVRLRRMKKDARRFVPRAPDVLVAESGR